MVAGASRPGGAGSGVRVDLVASEPHFVDHLAPVYLALAPDVRGDFVLIRSRWSGRVDPQLLEARARSRGVTPTWDLGIDDRPTLVASYGDLKMMRPARRVLAAMEHGIGQSFVDSTHGSYAGGRDRHDVSLFLTPNDHSAQRWRDAYPDAMVEVVGCPKLDSLPHRDPGPGPVVAISFHWGGGSPPETRSAWDDYRRHLPLLVERFTVIGHGHPRHQANLFRSYQKLGIPLVPDFADVCRQADVYACDTNSTIFEFASTGRPVVLLNKPGRDGYRKHVHHGLRFWDAATVGVQCDDPAQLADKVADALRDPPAQRKARDEALDVVYRYRRGGAQRAAQALSVWARASERKVA